MYMQVVLLWSVEMVTMVHESKCIRKETQLLATKRDYGYCEEGLALYVCLPLTRRACEFSTSAAELRTTQE